jgi:hypothetical protein
MPNMVDLELLTKGLAALAGGNSQQVQKAVGSTPNYTYGYSGGGMFAVPGLSAGIFSALQLPITGLQSRLPSFPSNETNPLAAILTGITAPTGTNPNGVCDDPKTVGLSTLCTNTAPFGRWSLQTAVIDIDKIGKRVNRGVFTDLKILNSPDMNGLVPTLPGGANNVQSLVKSEIAKIFMEFGAGWIFAFGKQTFAGNPANNTAGGGYMEFQGLDILINNGKHDALSGALCPAADSLLFDFGSNNITGSATNATNLYNKVVAMYRTLKYKARRMQFGAVKWVLVMTENLFYSITEIWPCLYNTTNCSAVVAAPVQVVQVGSDAVKMRDDMRDGSYLWINGEKVEVVLDDAVTETTSNGTDFVSTFYFVPLTVLGGTPVTYYEYFDYDADGSSMAAAKLLAPDGSYMSSDGGRFLWHKKPPTNFCVQFLAKTEPRLRCTATQLAGRIYNIKYTPNMVTNSPWPGDSTYIAGGTSTQATSWFNYTTP